MVVKADVAFEELDTEIIDPGVEALLEACAWNPSSPTSSPEILIKETLEFLKDYYEGVNITTMQGVEEKTVFKPLLNFS